MTRLFAKIAFLIIPCFTLIAGCGLYFVVEREVADAGDQLSMRMGNAAARTASSLTRLSLAASGTLDPTVAQALVGAMASDPALRCAELRNGPDDKPLAMSPRGLGCRAENLSQLHILELPVAGLAMGVQWTLKLVYDDDELDAIRENSRNQALAVLAGGLLITLISAGAGFHIVVERPLATILKAILGTGSGQFEKIEMPQRRDEFAEVISAFNDMQIRLAEAQAEAGRALGEIQQIYDLTPAMLCSLDGSGTIVNASQYCQLSLTGSDAPVMGQRLEDFADAGEQSPGMQKLKRALERRKPVSDLDLSLKCRQETMDVLVSAIPWQGGGDTTHLCVMTDVTELHRAQDELVRLANTDALTGLPNRRSLMDRLSGALRKGAAGQPRLTAMLFVDLDNFKTVNDRLGHDVGDRLLIEAASRLMASAGPDGVVARLGGDEFAILVFENGRSPLDIAKAVVDNIGSSFEPPIGAGLISASVGVARLSREDITADDIVRHADRAMYDAKDRGKSCFATYEPLTGNMLDA